MTEVVLQKSNKKDKKFDAVITKKDGSKKTVSFGQAGYSDFTKHKNEERKERYIARHGATQSWTDINKPQTWSRYLLWEEKTIPKAINKMERKFNIDIKNKT